MKKVELKPISDQVIVITGASSGIGLATAKLAASQGAKVVLASRNLKDLKKICKEIQAEGGESTCVKADVANEEEVQAIADHAIETFGRIDTWVNNAGTSIYGKLLNLDIKDEKRLFDVNFWGIRHGCHVAIEALKENGGVLINLGSEVSERSIPLQGIYSATKHAVKAYTEALRVELEHDEVPVHLCLIRPTAINTPFPEHALNKLEHGVPKLPTPVYDPYVVAEAIIKCATHPMRDVFVGGPSKLTQVMQNLSPKASDKQNASAFRTQVKRAGGDKREEALHKVPKAEGQVHGNYPISEEKKTSYYTKATISPLATGLVTTLVTAGIATLAAFLKDKE